MEIKLVDFPQHGDHRGQLVAIEAMKNIPFEIKRCYFMYDTKQGVRRGYHAHKKLTQILFCVSGSCKIHLDDGKDTAEVLLDKPYQGLLITSDMWREMYDFTEDAVLMVLADEYYNEEDYIRDYDTFLNYVRRKNDGNTKDNHTL